MRDEGVWVGVYPFTGRLLWGVWKDEGGRMKDERLGLGYILQHCGFDGGRNDEGGGVGNFGLGTFSNLAGGQVGCE